MISKLLIASLLAAIAIPVLAQSANPVDQVKQDNAQIRRDQRDINKDKRDINKDQRTLNQERSERDAAQRKEDHAIKSGDMKDAKKFENKREHEQREINNKNRDIAHDHAELHKDRQAQATDVGQRNKAAAAVK
jgi:hypothetical protein